MPSVLYTRDILRLAASIPHQNRLDAPDGRAECRSPLCGSRVAVDVILGADGRVSDFGIEAHACALGQASAALMGRHAIGRNAADLARATADLRAYLEAETGADAPAEGAPAPSWPGLEIFAAARAYPARHPSILLAFEAATLAAQRAAAPTRQAEEAQA